MLAILLICTAMLVASTLIHYESLRALYTLLPRLPILPPRVKLILVILGAFAGHTLEVLLYAFVYHALASHPGWGSIGSEANPSLLTCLYFSLTTYTSLGYGDVVPTGDLRLMAGSEALVGLLLIGWTAAYLYISMERFWDGTTRPRRR